MLWSAFVDAIETHLATEANRRGLEAFRSRHIRNAVLDLQRYIRGYRNALKTTYEATDLTTIGRAQQVDLPDGAIPKELWLYQADDLAEGASERCCREKMEFYPWANRQDMICGALSYATWYGCCCTNTGNCPPTPLTADEIANWQAKGYVWTMAPMGRNLLIHPQVTSITRLLLVYDGYLYSPEDGDTVPFPEEASEAVAYYLLSKISQFIDKNPAMAQAYMNDYKAKRLELYRDFRERVDDLVTDPGGQEYGATVVPP